MDCNNILTDTQLEEIFPMTDDVKQQIEQLI